MDASYRQRMHPLIAAASVSVILVSILGAAALTGVLPGSRSGLPQDISRRSAPDVSLAAQAPAVAAKTAATLAAAGPDVVPPVPAPAGPVAPAVPAAAQSGTASLVSVTGAHDNLAAAPEKVEGPVTQPVPVPDAEQSVPAVPVPAGSSDRLAVKPVVPAENLAASSGASVASVASEAASGARGSVDAVKPRTRTRNRHVAVLTPAEPVESPRIVPVYREPAAPAFEAPSPAVAGARTIAGIDATVNANHEGTPVEAAAPPQKAPAPVATYPVVTPYYPAKSASRRAGAATDASTSNLDAAGRPRRQAMRAVPTETPGNQLYPRASESGEGGAASRLGSAAGRSLGDTIDRTVSVLVGVLSGGRDEPRPTQPRNSDAPADATYR